MGARPRGIRPWIETIPARVFLGFGGIALLALARWLGQPWGATSGSWVEIVGHPMPPMPLTIPTAIAAFASMFMLTLAAVSFRELREIGVDEGGVRFTSSRGTRYYAFEEIEDARIVNSPFGNRLVLFARSGTVRLPLADTRPSELLDRILTRIAQKRAAPSPPPAIAMLARGERELTAWLEAVRAATQTGGVYETYRAPAADLDALERTLADEAARTDLRAAAAYVLLSSDERRGEHGADGSRMARALAMIGAGTPPLVVAAAALAIGADHRLDPETVQTASKFLSASGRSALQSRKAAIRMRVDENAPAFNASAVGRASVGRASADARVRIDAGVEAGNGSHPSAECAGSADGAETDDEQSALPIEHRQRGARLR